MNSLIAPRTVFTARDCLAELRENLVFVFAIHVYVFCFFFVVFVSYLTLGLPAGLSTARTRTTVLITSYPLLFCMLSRQNMYLV